ncbi:LolA-related protein [Thiolapillus sp.]
MNDRLMNTAVTAWMGARKAGLAPVSLGAGILFCLSLLSPLQAGERLQGLMDRLASAGGTEVSFVEEKHLDMLDVPLIQKGRLRFIPPDRFERVLEGPGGGRFVIDGQRVLQQQGDTRRELDLEQLPAVQAFAASFGATLRGDLEMLQKYYEINFDDTADTWVLELLPKDPQLQRFVTRIVLRGQGGLVKRMEVYEVNGDWSDMRLLYE